jgi:hypothetical protein
VLGLLGSVDAALWGAGSVVKRELVALALACRGACEVISCLFFSLFPHRYHRVFAMLVSACLLRCGLASPCSFSSFLLDCSNCSLVFLQNLL